MPRARTKAEKRRAKQRLRQLVNLSGGETAHKPLRGRAATGRRPQETPEEAVRTVKFARIRQGAPEALALAPIASEDIGLCILELAPAEAAELWQVWCALSAARRNYRARIIGQTGEPKNATIAMQPDPMQTDQSPRVDLRDPDAKDADAIAAWARWQARLDLIEPPMLRWALRDPLDKLAGALWLDGRPTHRGRNAVLALRRLHAQGA